MTAIAECPSNSELDRLDDIATSFPLDRSKLAAVLEQVADGLRERGRALDNSGGLLNEKEKAARMSLAREDDRLRHEISSLFRKVEEVGRFAKVADEAELQHALTELLADLRSHRQRESSLVLESADTEVGAGD